MEENPLVSIITVVYNGSKTIKQTIESVKNQTYKNIEYIIVDGASTDGTQQIVNRYIEYIDLFISEKDDGIYDAMNKGIQHATGSIIGIINSDDWYKLDAIETVVAYLKENFVDLVYGNIEILSKDGKLWKKDKLPLETIWYQMAVPHQSVFIKKKIYDKYGLFDLQYGLSADYELLLRLYSKGIRFGFLNKTMAVFREGGASQIYGDIGEKETYQIACRYVSECDRKEEVMTVLNNKKEWILFKQALQQNPVILAELLKKYFQTELDKIILFGTGVWGKQCYKALENTDLKVDYFLDNYCKEESLYGKEVKKVNEVQLENKYVLIVVKTAQKIVEQLEKIYNVNYVTISDVMKLYVSNVEK